MSGCKIVEYNCLDWLFKCRWIDDYYWDDIKISSEQAKEGVLYRGIEYEFYTRHNGKLIGLKVSIDGYGSWIKIHKQLHDLIEIEGLTPYDAFKVLCL